MYDKSERILADIDKYKTYLENFSTIKKGDTHPTLSAKDLEKIGKKEDLADVILKLYKAVKKCHTTIN